MKKLELEILEEIIKNPSLKLKDEDSLIDFVLELYEIDRKYSTLFEYVEFKNVSINSLKEFIDVFDIDFLNSKIWERICQRFISSETSKEKSDQNKTQDYIEIKHEEGNEFDVLLRYLSDKTDGNIHENGTIEVTSNSIHSDSCHPKYLFDYQNTESNFYLSKGIQDEFICFDFKDRKNQLTSYTIKSFCYSQGDYHLKNWIIEVSNDKENWIIIDDHRKDPTLNGNTIVATFNIKENTNFYQYVRLRQTGLSWNGSYVMRFYALEMYGKLYEPNKAK